MDELLARCGAGNAGAAEPFATELQRLSGETLDYFWLDDSNQLRFGLMRLVPSPGDILTGPRSRLVVAFVRELVSVLSARPTEGTV